MGRNRTYSADFKRQVALEYLGGESVHGLSRRHGMSRTLIDRVLHHCHLVNIRGNSYRMREHSDLSQALRADAESATPPRRQRKTGSAKTS